MAGIVPSLFGPTPQELEAQRRQQQADLQKAYAAQGPRAGAGAALGTLLGQGLTALFGNQDPAIQRANNVYKVLQDTQTELGADVADPTKLYPILQQRFTEAGFPDVAAKVAEEGSTKIVDWQTKQATIKQKEFDLKQDQEAKLALQELNRKASEEGRTPTTEEIIAVLSDKLPAEKLAPLLQTSADKAAYRDVLKRQIDQAHEDKLARIETIKDEKEKDRELKKELAAYDRQTKELITSLKGSGSKSSVYEKGYANNFVTSSAELVPATTNLNILTQGGVSPITAGVFTNLKGTGLLSATGAAFGNTVTSAEAGQYESIMLPVIQNIGTMQNAGRRTTIAQLDNLKNALIAKPGQPYIVQVQKMGELRQIAEAATEAAMANPALSDDQKALVKANLEKVKEAIPFTGADVAKFSVYAKKNPNVKFKDWLKVNGSDKETLKQAPKEALDKLAKDPSLAPAFQAKYGYLPEGTK